MGNYHIGDNYRRDFSTEQWAGTWQRNINAWGWSVTGMLMHELWHALVGRKFGQKMSISPLQFSFSLTNPSPFHSLQPHEEFVVSEKIGFPLMLIECSPTVHDVPLDAPVTVSGLVTRFVLGYAFEGSTALLSQNPAGVIDNVDSFNWLTIGTSTSPSRPFP